jgi:hypothetical protein
MRARRLWGAVGLVNTLASSRAGAVCNPTTALALAYRYAPVHYQDADSDKYRSDMLARIDFDGDWTMTNNWEAAAAWTTNPQAYVYYSVVSTTTHWYVLYAFYHPQDWTDTPFDQEHENDLEGMIAVVYRDGTQYGRLEGVVTVAHTDHWSYTPAGSHFTAGAESVDGTLAIRDGSHPLTFQEAKGHGLYAYGGGHVEDGDGIWYYPSLPYLGSESATTPATPTPASGDANPVAYYRLLDVFATGGLWSRRFDATTFASFGTFRGDTGGGCGSGTASCATNSANAPWGWDDGDDGPVFAGELAYDPAHLVSDYFRTTTGFARDYDCNPYAVEITLDQLYVASNQDGGTDRSDPYFNLFMSDGKGRDTQSGYGDGVVDGDSGAQVSWIWWDPPMFQWLALGPVMPRNRFYTIKTALPTFRIRVMDWDADSGDEWLMSPASYFSENATSGSFTYNFSRSSLKVTLVSAPNR